MKKYVRLSIICTTTNLPLSLVSFIVLLFANVTYAQTGRSLHFDGNFNNRVDLPFVLNGSYSKEAWIKPDAAALNSFSNIISGDATAFYLSNGQLTAGHANPTFPNSFNSVQDPTPMVAGNWCHVAVTYNASTNEMKLYKNGVEVGAATDAPVYTETIQHLSFFNGGFYFFGEMDEVRFWKTPRTTLEINTYKDCELTGDEPQLIAYYNFNQGNNGANNLAETALLDRTDRCGLPNNGTMVGFVLTGGNTSNWVSPGATLNGSCNVAFPNINITGNSICILPGDNTPVIDDNTSFGTFFSVPITSNFSIQNTGLATLTIGSIQITGTNASDFSVTTLPASTVVAGDSTTFTISFNGTGSSGLKTAIVTLNSNDGDEAQYTFSIEGNKADNGKSLDFDGVDDYVDLPFAISGSYTKEVWLKTATVFGFGNVLTGSQTSFYLDNGRMVAGHAPSFNQIIDPDSNPITPGLWYHFAVSYDASTQVMKLYRNGALIATANGVVDYINETPLKIGVFGSFYFLGRLDQARVWSKVRTDAEILSSYNCKISGDEPGLKAWYNFSNGISGGNNIGITTLLDDADRCNKNNGLLQNFNLDAPASNWLDDSILTNNNCVLTFPNIKISGNNNCILNADVSPEDADNTDFGNTTPTGVSKTFVITNTGNATLNIGTLSFTGTDNSMFTLTTPPSATLTGGSSTNFTVLFSPLGLGLKTASINILSDDEDENPYVFSIQGTGIAAPLVINNIAATPNVNGTATITWNTDIAATSVVDYGTDSLNLNHTEYNAALVTNHSIQLTGLTLGVAYYFRVTSVDGSNNSITIPTIPAAPLSYSMPASITLQPASATGCTGASIVLSSAASSNVALTVQWQISTDNGNSWLDSTGATNTSISLTLSLPDSGKQYRAVWTNTGGSNTSNAAIISVNPTSSSITNVTICSTALPYVFNDSSFNATGTYLVTLPNANSLGCDSLATLNLTVNNFSLIITNPPLACIDDNNGTFTATASNGLAPFEYSIDNGVNWFASGTFSNLIAGVYNLRIRDAADCTKDSTVIVGIEKAIWTGAESIDWHNPANWSNNQVPTTKTHVIIANTSVNECIISNNNAVAASIQAKTGVQLKVENSRTIVIAGNCTTLPAN